MRLRGIIKEVIKRSVIGYPPNDHLDGERTIRNAIKQIREEVRRMSKVRNQTVGVTLSEETNTYSTDRLCPFQQESIPCGEWCALFKVDDVKDDGDIAITLHCKGLKVTGKEETGE